jgi:3-oxoadipate enol-lactonase
MVASAVSFGFLPKAYAHLGGGYVAEYCDVGAGEPIVLVPGLAGGVDLLEPLIRELAREYRVIAYDLRGEHYDLFDRGFGFQQLVHDLDTFVRTIGLERPAIFGVSFGGALALEYAAQHSTRLSFLVVQGIGKRFRPGLFGDVAQEVLNRLPLPYKNPFVSQFLKVLMGQHACHRERDFDFVVDRCWQTDQSVVAHRLRLLADCDLRGRLPHVSVATLVLAGNDDVVVPPAQAEDLARSIPHARFCAIPNAGHLACVTEPGQLSQSIHRFARLAQTHGRCA